MASIVPLASALCHHAQRWRKDESGATAVEYGLLAALISISIMTALFATGSAIRTTLYEHIATALASM